MKTIARLFALSLVITGAVATSHIKNNDATPRLDVASSAMPTPACPPDDPNACGITQLGR